jgi:hypothetical protein
MEDKMNKVYLGETGVDSGQIIISDPCYVNMADVNKTIKYSDMCVSEKRPSKQLINKFGATVGVTVSTTVGDGAFPVYGRFNSKGQLKQIVIDIE